MRGKKVYGIMRPSDDGAICYDEDLEKTKRALDSTFSVLVEAEVTRLFTRERELVEIDFDSGEPVKLP